MTTLKYLEWAPVVPLLNSELIQRTRTLRRLILELELHDPSQHDQRSLFVAERRVEAIR